MKKLLASTMVLALVASTAGATGWGKPSTNSTNKNYNTNTAHGGNGGHGGAGGAGGAGGTGIGIGKGGNANQAQGQAQKQAQGQTQSAKSNSASNSAANSSSNSRGGSATNAGNAQNVNVNTTNKRSAYAPDAYAGDCGFGVSGGVPGASAGFSIPGKWCRVREEAAWLEENYGEAAERQHMIDNNPRIRKTLRKQITSQQPVVSKVSTRNRPAKAPTAMRGEDR